ncbi:WXG100 family type VII secretion target [Phytoactinopolyspora endophytica]|uniref:WXG100 family type VII secretion target n=1 Tax=Phytoactinopolyspora endophytica TaxID=1642495 RepID=UPI00101C975B|nr:WXG100 family type VII secretion target [Phytoactinopolyspora endophytica]
MAVGAELQTLQELYRTFNAKAEDAQGIKDNVDGGIEATVWEGTYATQFREAWEGYKSNLDTLRQALEDAAQDVLTNHNNMAEAFGEPDRLP